MAVFALGGPLASALPELAIGPWTHAPTTVPTTAWPGLVSFSADPDPPASVWRIDLGRADAASRAALADGERSVARSHAVLDGAPRRLELALAGLVASAERGRALAPELPPIEASLVAELARIAAVPARLVAWDVQGAGLPGASLAGLAQPPGPLERALQRASDLIRGRARIETHVEGALVACTIMRLSGDTEIWLAPRLDASTTRLHARSGAVAVRTRNAWARVLAFIVSGGARLSALGLPAAGLSALPVVWRFVRDVLRDVGEHAID